MAPTLHPTAALADLHLVGGLAEPAVRARGSGDGDRGPAGRRSLLRVDGGGKRDRGLQLDSVAALPGKLCSRVPAPPPDGPCQAPRNAPAVPEPALLLDRLSVPGLPRLLRLLPGDGPKGHALPCSRRVEAGRGSSSRGTPGRVRDAPGPEEPDDRPRGRTGALSGTRRPDHARRPLRRTGRLPLLFDPPARRLRQDGLVALPD